MRILGIETSCDETAAAVVTDRREILSNIIHSQVREHAPYGGVVPEIASRAHIRHLDGVIRQAMDKAGLAFAALDGIAVTAGPGLIGGLMTGLMTAKGLASALRKPLLAVNHLEGHALTVRLTDGVAFPFLLLLVSGGHCQLLLAEGVGKYQQLGTTRDDALGEAFDKVAKTLGLPYPGGPEVERRALHGNPDRFSLPAPMLWQEHCDFSFSGLKTAVWRCAEAHVGARDDRFIADLCAAFQATCGKIVEDRTRRAMHRVRQTHPETSRLVIAGGVAANRALRTKLEALGAEEGWEVIAPPPALCTDNAAMIAWAGIERLQLGLTDGPEFAPRPRWPLEEERNSSSPEFSPWKIIGRSSRVL